MWGRAAVDFVSGAGGMMVGERNRQEGEGLKICLVGRGNSELAKEPRQRASRQIGINCVRCRDLPVNVNTSNRLGHIRQGMNCSLQ